MADDGFMGLLSSILAPLQMGARSTLDALDQDVESLKERQPPEQAIKALEQMVGQLANPSVNPVIPALKYTRMLKDPNVPAGERMKSWIVPGGDWPTVYARTGGFGNFLEELLQSMIYGNKSRPTTSP